MYEALNNVKIMSRASHKDTCKSDDIRVNKNSKLKSEIYECKDYMYREKRSAKLNRVLVSLKEHVSQKKIEHTRNSLQRLIDDSSIFSDVEVAKIDFTTFKVSEQINIIFTIF